VGYQITQFHLLATWGSTRTSPTLPAKRPPWMRRSPSRTIQIWMLASPAAVMAPCTLGPPGRVPEVTVGGAPVPCSTRAYYFFIISFLFYVGGGAPVARYPHILGYPAEVDYDRNSRVSVAVYLVTGRNIPILDGLSGITIRGRVRGRH
jgi:hypothetical protein